MSEAKRSGPPRARVFAAAMLTLSMGLLASAESTAQTLYGSVNGSVKDSSGAAIPGATVTITNKETSLVRDGSTTDDGGFSIINVLPGTYDLKVSLQGFREYVKTNVGVSAGTTSRVEVSLEVGQLSETVTVASPVELLQTDRADTHTELKAKELVSMPLPAYRNYQSLINLVPGATPAIEQNALTDTPGRSLRTFVNGANPNNNATKSDGATNVNLWLPHHVMYVAPAETIDTVNVSTSNFDAETGMAGGAAITVITKSGTNEFKGSAFEFFNNEKLNARPYFATAKTPVDRNIFGGTLGGPIAKNRLFFFGSYEGFFERSTAQAFFNVPTEAMRNGDFNGAVNAATGVPQIVYDPSTGNADGTGRTPFAGNRIPSNRVNEVSKRIQTLYPLPNTGAPGALANNYVRNQDTKVDRNNFDAKVNWNRTSSHQIWGKFSLMDATVSNLFYLGVDGGGNGKTKVYQGTGGHTWTLSPTMILDSTFGFSRQDQNVQGPDFDLGNYGTDVLGIPGTNGPDPRQAGIPQFDFVTFSALGNNAGWNPLERDERTYAFGLNLTKVHNNHEFRAGYNVNYLWMNHWQPEVANPRGQFAWATNATRLNGGTVGQDATIYNNYAAFLLGLVGTSQKSLQYELMTAREWQHGLYVRDRWQVNSKLTLDLGLRYELYPLMNRADRGIERLDLNTMEVLLGGVGGNPTDLGIKTSKTLFAPRLGVVYRINEETVFRTGYGITYNPLPWARPMRGFYPLTIATNNTNPNQFLAFNRVDQGIPAIVGPDLSTGRVPLPPTVDMRTPEPDNVERGRIQSWNVALERRLPLDVSIDLAYVGTRGDNGYTDVDINASEIPGGGDASRPLASRFGRTRDLKSWGSYLESEYHSLQMAINRPFKGGLLLKGAYTFSKAFNMSNNDEDGWTAVDFNSPSQFARNWARAGFDRPHVFQLGFVYELPFGKGEDGGGIAKQLVRDWQLNGVVSAFSGQPFTIRANATNINMPGNIQTGDQVGEFALTGDVGSLPFFNTSAFAQPTGLRFGDTGRNAFRGRGQQNLDLSIFRGFRMGGNRRLEVRAEGFNMTNTGKFNVPNEAERTVGNAIFGQNRRVIAGSERQFRLGLRFSF